MVDFAVDHQSFDVDHQSSVGGHRNSVGGHRNFFVEVDSVDCAVVGRVEHLNHCSFSLQSNYYETPHTSRIYEQHSVFLKPFLLGGLLEYCQFAA